MDKIRKQYDMKKLDKNDLPEPVKVVDDKFKGRLETNALENGSIQVKMSFKESELYKGNGFAIGHIVDGEIVKFWYIGEFEEVKTIIRELKEINGIYMLGYVAEFIYSDKQVDFRWIRLMPFFHDIEAAHDDLGRLHKDIREGDIRHYQDFLSIAEFSRRAEEAKRDEAKKDE